MQKARRQPFPFNGHRPSTVCKLLVSGSMSLPSLGFFSPFPHGTCSLSVINEYLALEGGPPRFKPGFTCPALLRCLPSQFLFFAYGAFTLCRSPSQKILLKISVLLWLVLQPLCLMTLVWALPASLAATRGISGPIARSFVDFFSSAY